MAHLTDLARLEEFVRTACSVDPAHDWWHVVRVRKLSATISYDMPCDRELVDLVALLHDAWDWKLGNVSTMKMKALTLLKELGFTDEKVGLIAGMVDMIGFNGSEVQDPESPVEVDIVRDADRLDAMGAIGIARAFSYGGKSGRPIYDPLTPPVHHRTREDYRKSTSSTINHFYEKLLLLGGRMRTKKGRELAQRRHEFMVMFLEEFFAEWSAV